MSVFDIFKKLDEQRAAEAPAGAVDFIICGLGNPGTQYENTRHNAGFMALDTLAGELKADVRKLRFKSLTADVVIEEQEFAESKAASSDNGGNYQRGNGNTRKPEVDESGFMNIPEGIDDELPFN